MPSGAAGACVIAKLFRLVAAELRERAVDKARLENVLGRRRDRQIAELPATIVLIEEFARMLRLCRVDGSGAGEAHGEILMCDGKCTGLPQRFRVLAVDLSAVLE